jgi:hypothetical protein
MVDFKFKMATGVKVLRMSGAVPLLPQHAFVVWVQTTLPIFF